MGGTCPRVIDQAADCAGHGPQPELAGWSGRAPSDHHDRYRPPVWIRARPVRRRNRV